MAIKVTMRYHNLFRVTIMKKGKYYIFEVMETLESLYTVVRM